MASHVTAVYKDDQYKWVVYCKVCGIENPDGECAGKFVPNRERIKVDNKLECKQHKNIGK